MSPARIAPEAVPGPHPSVCKAGTYLANGVGGVFTSEISSAILGDLPWVGRPGTSD